MRPPVEGPTRTYGPGTRAAFRTACRSATASAAVRGIGTGELRLNSVGPRVVPGRSIVHTRVVLATPGRTVGPGGVSSVRSLQKSERLRSPASRITVGAP